MFQHYAPSSYALSCALLSVDSDAAFAAKQTGFKTKTHKNDSIRFFPVRSQPTSGSTTKRSARSPGLRPTSILPVNIGYNIFVVRFDNTVVFERCMGFVRLVCYLLFD